MRFGVPNAPCGVERSLGRCVMLILGGFLFLMHRVELKEPRSGVRRARLAGVPNAPCGVERYL